MESRRTRVAALTELREGTGKSVRVEGMEVALFRRGEVVYAFENLCPHQHIPVLAEGELQGTILTCPMHGWQFDIADGRCVHASARLRTFDVIIEGDNVYIDIPEEEEGWW